MGPQVSRAPGPGASGRVPLRASMRHSAGAPVALLSPHLDDAVLSAWAVLRRGGPVGVVNVCAGIPPAGLITPWDRLTGARDGAERMRERLDEDRAALTRAGREAVNLDFLDVQYRAGPLDPDALLRAIAGAVPAASELWAPAGIGAHADHVQVREAALALAAGGGPPVRLYAELPYTVRYGWPEWVGGGRARPGLDLDGWLRAYLPEGTPLPGESHELPRAEARAKLRALRDYRTQWIALDNARVVSRRRAIRYEASFTAPAPSIPSSSATKRSSENRIA
jgi:LmbE family N-acetylglucosaminyl deacetylase